MELIHKNPYRVIGVLSNTTTRELEKQKGKIKAFAKVGKEIVSDYDFELLHKIVRTEALLTQSFSSLEQNQDKVNNALFWFLNVSPLDTTALEYLKNGDIEKAIEIWEKVTIGKSINSKNFAAFNNLGTLRLLSNNKTDVKKGVGAKITLIQSSYFEHFVHTVADETFRIDPQKELETFINQILESFKNQFTNAEIKELFIDGDVDVQRYLSQKLTQEPIHHVENQIEATKKKRKINKGMSYRYGMDLYASTKESLSFLKELLGVNDLKYKTLADQLANEIMQCGIDYFNESQESSSSVNYLESAQKLTRLADSIAVGKLTKDRAKDSLATLEDMKDREVNQAIALLNSIKLAYENAISEIDAQVARMRMTMSYNQSINYSKVDKMKASCLNWDKVVEVVSNGISMNNVEAIQRCSNQSKVSEYKSLVDFLLGKLGPIQINQVKHLCYWRDVRAAQASATAKKVGSTISSAADKGGCYIATMAYGDYDHPQVLELRKFRDDFLIKTILGRKFINFYYKYSPRLVKRLRNQQTINLIIRKGLDQFIKTIRK